MYAPVDDSFTYSCIKHIRLVLRMCIISPVHVYDAYLNCVSKNFENNDNNEHKYVTMEERKKTLQTITHESKITKIIQ